MVSVDTLRLLARRAKIDSEARKRIPASSMTGLIAPVRAGPTISHWIALTQSSERRGVVYSVHKIWVSELPDHPWSFTRPNSCISLARHARFACKARMPRRAMEVRTRSAPTRTHQKHEQDPRPEAAR